jgi:hypothetical protein
MKAYSSYALKRGRVLTSAVVLAALLCKVSGQSNSTAGVQTCPLLSCDVKNTKLDEDTCFFLVG